MEYINRIKILSIWIFITPVVVINLCLFITVNFELFENTIFAVDQIGRAAFTIPYIDGGVSISRASRTYPSYLLFKPGMIITSILLIQYWVANNRLIKSFNKENGKNKYFLFFGIGSAIFLILHSLFLGIETEINLFKLLRRIVLLGFIIFEIIAQALLVINFLKIKNKLNKLVNKKILALKIILVSILTIVAFVSAPILNSSEYSIFKHALEWNYFIGVVTFYLLTYLFWKRV